MAPAGNSSPVRTDQAGVHPDLERVVLRHLRSEWRKPLGRPTEEAWAEGGYEVDKVYCESGLPAQWTRDVTKRIMDAVWKIAE